MAETGGRGQARVKGGVDRGGSGRDAPVIVIFIIILVMEAISLTEVVLSFVDAFCSFFIYYFFFSFLFCMLYVIIL